MTMSSWLMSQEGHAVTARLRAEFAILNHLPVDGRGIASFGSATLMGKFMSWQIKRLVAAYNKAVAKA